MMDALETLTIALATGNATIALPFLAEDAEWEMVGRPVIVGRDAIAATLGHARPAAKVTIGRVLLDGRAGIVEGRIELTPTHSRRFCDLYELSGADGSTIRRITSWDIRA